MSSPQPSTARAWAQHRTVLVETRRRNGVWVPTAVSLVVDEAGRAFFRTYDASGKAKRLRNFTDIRVAPCNLRGKPTGTAVAATARLLHGTEAQHAREQLARKFPIIHGRVVPWLHRRKGWQTLHYELHFAPEQSPRSR